MILRYFQKQKFKNKKVANNCYFKKTVFGSYCLTINLLCPIWVILVNHGEKEKIQKKKKKILVNLKNPCTLLNITLRVEFLFSDSPRSLYHNSLLYRVLRVCWRVLPPAQTFRRGQQVWGESTELFWKIGLRSASTMWVH